MNKVDNDWLPVEAEAHQSWPPKKEKKRKTDKLTKLERQRKREREKKYTVIRKIAKNTKTSSSK